MRAMTVECDATGRSENDFEVTRPSGFAVERRRARAARQQEKRGREHRTASDLGSPEGCPTSWASPSPSLPSHLQTEPSARATARRGETVDWAALRWPLRPRKSPNLPPTVLKLGFTSPPQAVDVGASPVQGPPYLSGTHGDSHHLPYEPVASAERSPPTTSVLGRGSKLTDGEYGTCAALGRPPAPANSPALTEDVTSPGGCPIVHDNTVPWPLADPTANELVQSDRPLGVLCTDHLQWSVPPMSPKDPVEASRSPFRFPDGVRWLPLAPPLSHTSGEEGGPAVARQAATSPHKLRPSYVGTPAQPLWSTWEDVSDQVPQPPYYRNVCYSMAPPDVSAVTAHGWPQDLPPLSPPHQRGGPYAQHAGYAVWPPPPPSAGAFPPLPHHMPCPTPYGTGCAGGGSVVRAKGQMYPSWAATATACARPPCNPSWSGPLGSRTLAAPSYHSSTEADPFMTAHYGVHEQTFPQRQPRRGGTERSRRFRGRCRRP